MRDRDVRNAIQSTLLATGAFDGVWIWGLPENYGTGASQLAACAIEPISSNQQDLWDGGPTTGLQVLSTVRLTLLFRCEDPQLRDEGCELLFDTAANALNGQSLADLTMPDLTRFLSWSWGQPDSVERRVTSVFQYAYLVDSWAGYDVEA
jgi:hypothetical protein